MNFTANISKLTQLWKANAPVATYVAIRSPSTSPCLCKNVKAGILKGTPFRTLPLTYDETQAPHYIFDRKVWLSWNTSNLHNERNRIAETTFEDLIIRKFMYGTWHGALVSEVIIKRRHNMIILAFIASVEHVLQRQVYFLQGYTEELLSHWLKCPIKVELQCVTSKEDVVFKRI
ncbi:small ribosomal subunit protein uS3m-like [Physella acuta]|uniref:small ribosomal subunit protein uS3m-like n=1 Tax=Physella acuta TaxID=109671 RepID=UPI0027DC0237|nr:small ribosomal subunit protein uS3m-like [Physella acuta]